MCGQFGASPPRVTWVTATMPLMDIDLIRAVLLDMDGTLVDSDASVERAWVAWAHRYNVDPALALSVAHGNPADATVRGLRQHLAEAEAA